MKEPYRRMLNILKSKPVEDHCEDLAAWFVYILKCCDGTFYTGITNDLKRRYQQHNKGRGARYTRTRVPVELLYSEECKNRSQALIREAAIKSLPRKKKEELVR